MSGEDEPVGGISALEEKVKRLEESLKEIREPIEKTLIDLRKMLSDLENPFNILLATQGQQLNLNPPHSEDIGHQSALPIVEDHPVERPPLADIEPTQIENKSPQEQVNVEPIKAAEGKASTSMEPSLNRDERPSNAPNIAALLPSIRLANNNKHLSTLACASILLSMFDEEELRQNLNLYVAKGWIPKETALAIKEALEVLPRDLNNLLYRRERRARMEDHVIAVYLLNKLNSSDGCDETFFLILLLLSKIYGQGLYVNHGPLLDLKGEDRKLFNVGG